LQPVIPSEARNLSAAKRFRVVPNALAKNARSE
jgi:hypothetical protein